MNNLLKFIIVISLIYIIWSSLASRERMDNTKSTIVDMQPRYLLLQTPPLDVPRMPVAGMDYFTAQEKLSKCYNITDLGERQRCIDYYTNYAKSIN